MLAISEGQFYEPLELPIHTYKVDLAVFCNFLIKALWSVGLLVFCIVELNKGDLNSAEKVRHKLWLLGRR